MPATATDYWWVTANELGLFSFGYCVSLVCGATVDELVGELGATRNGSVRGFAGLAEPSFSRWEEPDAGRVLVVGLASLGGWALMAEVNGFVGVTPEVMAGVAARHEVIAHYQNVNAVDRFHWWRNGELVLDIEPLLVDLGAVSQELRDELAGAGLGYPSIDSAAASFALADRLSRIRITPTLFFETTFVTAEVGIPS
jgi:hypothetical protein